jgi:hypothetical protein
VRPQAGKLDKIWETLIRKFLGIDMNLTPDWADQRSLDLTLHDENVLLVVDAESVKDLEQYRQFGPLQRYHIKVILMRATAGAAQVPIQLFADDDIPDRLWRRSRRCGASSAWRTPLIGRSSSSPRLW